MQCPLRHEVWAEKNKVGQRWLKHSLSEFRSKKMAENEKFRTISANTKTEFSEKKFADI
jgi:hypothetical protein